MMRAAGAILALAIWFVWQRAALERARREEESVAPPEAMEVEIA